MVERKKETKANKFIRQNKSLFLVVLCLIIVSGFVIANTIITNTGTSIFGSNIDLGDNNISSNGTASLNLDGQDRFTITGYNVSGNNINWSDLYEFPVACPEGTYLTELGDSVICTSISAADHDNLTVGDLTATNISAETINDVYYVQAGNGSDIQAKIDLCEVRGKGCKIEIPVGIYNLTAQINISKTGVLLQGQSRGVGAYNFYHDYSGGTILIARDGFPTGDSVIFAAANGTGIRDLVVDANDIAKYGINYYQGWEKYVSNTMIFRATDTGFIASAQTINGENAGSGNWLDHVTSADNGINGFYFVKTDYRMNDLYGWDHNDGSFIHLVGGGHQISNIHSYWSKYGIYVNGSGDNSVVSAVLEGTNISAIYFDSTNGVIKDFSLTGSAMYLNDRRDEGNAIFSFNAPNSIKGILIQGNVFNDWETQAQMFDYNESQDANIESSFFNDNIYYYGLGNVPSGMVIGERKASTADVILDMNFDEVNSVNENRSFDNSINSRDVILTNVTRDFERTSFRGGYYTVDGESSYITIPDVKPVGESFSVSVWVKTEDFTQTQAPIIIKGNENNYLDYRLVIGSTGFVSFGTQNTSTGSATPTTTFKFVDDDWYHIVTVIDKNESRYSMYVDGRLNYTGTGTYNESRRYYSTSNVTLGYSKGMYFGDTYFNGSIDSVKFYNRALTYTEVQTLYEENRKAEETKGIGRYGGTIYGDVDILANLTITQKITFALGEIIDNIVDGWISITGNLTVSGDVNVSGDLISDTIHEVSSQGLVLSMNFNNGSISGNNVLDSSTRNNHGINNGAIHNSTVGFNSGGVYEFDGVGDYIEIANDDSLNFGTEDFSVSLWFYPKQELGTQRIFSKAITYRDKQFEIQFGEEIREIKVRFGDDGANTDLTYVTPSINQWINVVLVRESGIGYLYVDEILKDTDTVNYNITNTMDLRIGVRSDTFLAYFNGSIDEVKTYSRALSADEVKALYYQRAEVDDSYVSQKDIQIDSSGNVNITSGNLTLTEKITFKLGEIIDNIVDGWITITGGLNVTESLNVVGNITGNYYYGEMWMYNLTGYVTTAIGTQNVWYNITGFNSTNVETGQELNGFIYDNANEHLTASINGKYKVSYSVSTGNVGNNEEYIFGIAINGVIQNNTLTHRKIGVGGDVGNTAGTGFIDLSSGDYIQLIVQDKTGTANLLVQSSNINLVRIGN